MANRTAKEAKVVHGTNPQYLVEKIIRTRIYESRYWKEECFGLSAADVFEKAIALRFIGGTYGGNIKPSPFLCLTLKMLQIQPDKDIIIHFIGKTGMYYLRTKPAANAIQFTIDKTRVKPEARVKKESGDLKPKPTAEEILVCSRENKDECLMCSA